MARVEIARAAVQDLDALIRTHSLPADTKQRLVRTLRPLEQFPHMGAPLEGRWAGFRFLLGPWRWLIVVYAYLEAYPPSDSINPPGAVQVQNAQSAPTTGSARPPEGTRKRRDAEPADSANRTWFLYLSLGVLGLLAVGIVFTQREFRRLSTEAHMRRSLRTHLVARALPIVARQNNSWVVEKTSGRPIALVPTGRKQQASSAKRLKDWWCPEELGDAC